jgi:cell wall-associated NlpC family hydrolase
VSQARPATPRGVALRRASLRLAPAIVTALLVVLALPAAAHAEPTLQEIEAQINKIWSESEPLIEEYNAVHDEYKANQAKQAELAEKIEPLERQVALAQLRIGVIASQVYQSGRADTLSAILASGSPDVLADQLLFLEQLALEQKEQLDEVTAMKGEYDAEKAPIDAIVAELAAQDADLAAKKKEIESRLGELQKLRQQAYGSSATSGSFRPWPCPAAFEPTKGYQAAAFACNQAGSKYAWAAEGPSSYDCSGLTLAAWRTVGVSLPHNAASQRKAIPYVSRSDLRVGDLVFYYSDLHHVAIYVGDGKVMHAPSFGDFVRMRVLEDVGPVHSYGRPG